jgi:hypothetical protein
MSETEPGQPRMSCIRESFRVLNAARRINLFVAIAAACTGWAASPAAAAEDAEPLADPRVWVQAGIFYPSINTEVRVARNGETGSNLDFETDLDFPDRRALPSGTLGVRLARGWHLIGDFYSLERSRTATAARDITFDGVTYPASGEVSAGFTSSVYRLTVNHDIITGKDHALGVALGAHVTNFSVFLEGQGQVGQAQVAFEQRRREALAPLPTVGIHARYRPMDRLQLSVRGDFLSLKIDDYDGRLLNGQASADYAITQNLSMGIMLRHVDYRLGVEKPDWNGLIRYRFTGPAAVATLLF